MVKSQGVYIFQVNMVGIIFVCTPVTLSTLGKIFSRHFKIFSFFFRKQVLSVHAIGDSLLKMQTPVF